MKRSQRFGMRILIAVAALVSAAFVAAPTWAAAPEAKVGIVFSMTGGAASYGATQKNGATLAVDEINAAAGAKGIHIKPYFDDDASTPQQGINVFKKFINEDNVSAIIGPTLSDTAQVTDRIAQASSIPVIGVSNTAPGITDIGNYVFRDSLTEAVVIPDTIRTAKKKFGISKVCLMYGNDGAYTKAGYVAFKKALTDEKITILSEQTFAKGDHDFAPQLTEIKSQSPDAIVVSALVEEASGIVSQARQLGIPASVHIIGGNGFNSPSFIKNAGKAANGVLIGAAWSSTSSDPLNRKFVKDYTAKFGTPPDQFAAQAYAGVYIVYNALQKAGAPFKPAMVRSAMAGIRNIDTVLGKFSFTAGRDADCKPVLQEVRGGKFVAIGG